MTHSNAGRITSNATYWHGIFFAPYLLQDWDGSLGTMIRTRRMGMGDKLTCLCEYSPSERFVIIY